MVFFFFTRKQSPAQISADDNTGPTPTGLIDVACMRENPDVLVTNTDFRSNKTVLQYECSNIYRRKAGTMSKAPVDDRVKSVHWSPLGVAVDGRCCLAVLTRANRVVVHAHSNRTAFASASQTSSAYLSSAEKWPLIRDVSEDLATLYKNIEWKLLPFTKEDGDENEDSRTSWKDAEKDEWKPINCFAAPGPPKVGDDLKNSRAMNECDDKQEVQKTSDALLSQGGSEEKAGVEKDDRLGESRVGQLRKGSRCEVKRDTLSSPWFTCTVLAAESDMFHRIRVQYDRKGMDNEWLAVSDVDNLGDESVQCGSMIHADRSKMKVKRWIRPAVAVTDEVDISSCPRASLLEIYKGHCWQLVEVVQDAKIRFQINGSAHSAVSNKWEVRKIRKWKGAGKEKGSDDGWEILEDLKTISLPAQQLEEEIGEDVDKEKGKEKDKNTKSSEKEKEGDEAVAGQKKTEKTKKIPATKKRKAASGKKKSNKDESDFDDDEEEGDDDEEFDEKKDKKKQVKISCTAGGAGQTRVAGKTTKADEKANDYSTITDTHPHGLSNAMRVSFTSCSWSPSFKDGTLESILTIGTKNGELVFFRVGTKRDDEIEEPFCELLGVVRAFSTSGVWVTAITYMPMKDRDIGDKLWTIVAGSSSGEAKLFLCDPKLLCNRTLETKVPEDWVVPISHFGLKETLVVNPDEVPITSVKCFRDQHVDGRRGLCEGKDVKVIALGKASGEVLVFRSDNISSRIRMFSESVQDIAFQRCDIGLRLAICAESGRRADILLQSKRRDQGQTSNEDFVRFDFSDVLNKDFLTGSGVSTWQRSVRAGGMCASPNNFLIARTFERYDYTRLPSLQKMQKIKGMRGILTFHGASAVDGDAVTKKIFSLANEFEGQSLWDCVELCSCSKTYWNAIANWCSHEMMKTKNSASQKKKYSLGAAFAMVSALLRKNSSRQPLRPRNAEIYDEDDNDELRVLVHVDQPEKGWVPESQRLQQRRRNVFTEEQVLSFNCHVCGPVHDDDDGNEDKDDEKKPLSFRSDLRCEICGLLCHESTGSDFRLKPSMI